MTSTEVPLGAKVQVAAGLGYVRWSGSNAKFATGKWVGVELSVGTSRTLGRANMQIGGQWEKRWVGTGRTVF